MVFAPDFAPNDFGFSWLGRIKDTTRKMSCLLKKAKLYAIQAIELHACLRLLLCAFLSFMAAHLGYCYSRALITCFGNELTTSALKSIAVALGVILQFLPHRKERKRKQQWLSVCTSVVCLHHHCLVEEPLAHSDILLLCCWLVPQLWNSIHRAEKLNSELLTQNNCFLTKAASLTCWPQCACIDAIPDINSCAICWKSSQQ